MKEVRYEFVELESDQSFQLLGKAFHGSLRNNTLHFNNPLVQGQIIKKSPEDGLWIRKWKLTVWQKVTLHRLAVSEDAERKFSLIYFPNPSIFSLKGAIKKVSLNTQRNNLFLPNGVVMDFTVDPKQPFYALDITFTEKWLLSQFDEADSCFTTFSDRYLTKGSNSIIMEPCTVEDYKILNELDRNLLSDKEDVLFTRSRIYRLICSFFSKVLNKRDATGKQKIPCHYEQIAQAEAILVKHLSTPPKIEAIAKAVNMSASSLLRQFRLMYGKSMNAYYIEKKMEWAKRMILEKQITINKVAKSLGYKQASPFIEIFTKHYGYSPGLLKIS